jgi:hypothetical protein
MRRKAGLVIALSLLVARGSAFGQALPTSQPNFVQVIIEDVKVGHEDEHSKLEAGWPAAFEKAKSPYYSLGMTAWTGPLQAWFLAAFDSNAAIGDSIKRSSDDPVLAAELARLSRADSAHINGLRTLLGAARKDLSRGAFPDLAKQRFFEVTIFRVRPGHEADFTAAGKAFGAAATRLAPNTAYRVYEIVAGMPGPSYMIISSVAAFGEFDKVVSDGEAIMKGATPEEQAALQKFGAEALINAETQRFRLDPNMCYVPKEVRAQDPAFWNPKKPAPPKPTSQP